MQGVVFDGRSQIGKSGTGDNPAALFTKCLGVSSHEQHVRPMGYSFLCGSVACQTRLASIIDIAEVATWVRCLPNAWPWRWQGFVR